jgi:hypothetical protein
MLQFYFSLNSRSIPKARSARVKNAIISIEKDVSINSLAAASNALQRPEASASTASRAEVEERGRDRGEPGANGDGEGWKRRAAGEGVPSLRGVVGGAGDFLIVVCNG